jgi:RNA polymerase sigma-70 factor (ECF subfamily)
MLFHDSRRDARVAPDGELVLLEDQDRSLWDDAQIAEGRRVLGRAITLRHAGPYQVHGTALTLTTNEAEHRFLTRRLREVT